MKHCPKCDIFYEAVFCPLCEARKEIEEGDVKIETSASDNDLG